MKNLFYNSMNSVIALCVLAALCSCNNYTSLRQTYTTQDEFFVTDSNNILRSRIDPEETLIINTSIDTCYKQQVLGFGACFNELGWTSLSRLSEDDRQRIIKELFEPNSGANFTICRMPIGANDFSRDWYSYNETDGDFDMKDFSIEQDLQTLIPFIRSAQHYNLGLMIWASPWSPPTWMKRNRHYAMRPHYEGTPKQYQNHMQPWQIGREGTDQFILRDDYLRSYALYFGKFIDAYKEKGIDIYGVMPQNEFNSDQVFPSCCWTAKGLTRFVGEYLGPEMKKRGVDVMFGTMERPNWLLVDSVLRDEKASKYVSAVGFQWAGKDAVKKVKEAYPNMLIYQTEQECGDGKNDWAGLLHSWDLLKHYFDNGVSVYNYWNISLDRGGVSRWGWAQNSLVVVDPIDSSYRFTYEYYLMKHISHFVKPQARMLKTSGRAEESITFINTDNSVVVLYMERKGAEKQLEIMVDGKRHNVRVKPNSINTFVIK